MSAPYVAEIRILPFNFAPTGWAFCQGQILPISQNTALFSLLGTNYGGNGTSNFALPNLSGAVALHANNTTYLVGQSGGETAHTLTTSEMPAHTHTVSAESYFRNAVDDDPSGAVPAAPAPLLLYSNVAAPSYVPMNAAMVSVAGGSQPHNNLMPYLVLNYCIALQGVFPPRN